MNREGKKCVLYPRVSTEMQVDGYSLEGQKNSLKRFADREEMEIVGIYEDAGKSGKSIEGRPAFKKMLSDIKNGLEIDYILVYKLSRFGRNAADILNSLEFVQSYGINLICIEEGIDSSQTSGKLLISVLSAVAEIERENITVTDKTSVASNSDSSKEDSNDSNSNEDNKQESEKITLASQDSVKTEVVTPNPISENVNVQYGKVKIKNQTTYNLTEDILNPNISIDNKNVLIFHTHSCESYTPSEKYSYSQTGNYRTTDMNFTVTRVGTELENYLKQYNINVIHDKSYHDYPSYTGSYTRSLKTVENILKTTPSDIIIDLHRDAVGSRPDYAPTVKIGDDYAAQIMFVIGTNEGGLWHPNWQQNLKFAVKVQQKAEEMYPGLFKPIMLTKSRYNQHTGKFANIIEVGATGNTLEQCLTSMKYLSAVMNEVMK